MIRGSFVWIGVFALCLSFIFFSVVSVYHFLCIYVVFSIIMITALKIANSY